MGNWTPFNAPTDVAIIDGIATPGVCKYESDGYRNEVENKRINGSIGQFAIVKGRDIPKFSLTCTLHDDAAWAQWALLRPVLDALPTGRLAKAMAVVHPQVQELGITAATYLGRTSPADQGKGKWAVTLYFESWAPSKPKQSSINGANGPARQGKTEDEWDVKIREAKEQGDALANG